MEYVEKKRTGVLCFVTKVLNEAGGALVDIFDLGCTAVDKIIPIFKKVPGLPKKAMEIVKPSKAGTIEDKIRKKEEKIDVLYREIGKEGVKYSDTGVESPLETENVKGLISDVREYEKEIRSLKGRITELEEKKNKEAVEKKKPAKGKEKTEEVITKLLPVSDAIKAGIKTALESGVFETDSAKAKFEKVANDLLDDDMEIKILAVSELAKMKNEGAVPVLAGALDFEDSNLNSEIINALIELGDSAAIPLFKEKVKDPHHGVRVASLRGLYKLAEDDDEAIQLLKNALRDDHPDVRKSAITFIGWKDIADAVPALVQCLKDEDEKVRKAALSALAAIRDESSVLPLIRILGDEDLDMRKKGLDAVKMITGEDVAFDLQASGEELTEAIDDLADWWQEKRLGEVEVAPPEAEEAAEAEAEVVAEEGDVLTETNLMRKIKEDLIDICDDLGIERDETLTKTELTRLILEKRESD